jgi:hypothetical protein
MEHEAPKGTDKFSIIRQEIRKLERVQKVRDTRRGEKKEELVGISRESKSASRV